MGKRREFRREVLGTERRIICQWYREEREDNKSSLARSILSGYRVRLDGHKVVRVCDSALVVEPASKIYEKVNLRCVYCTYNEDAKMKLLPSSVSLIWNLQTLIIGNADVVAPIEIWKMRQLRHIKCLRIRLPNPLPSDDFLMMDNLQTLKKAEGLMLWEQVCKIIPNITKLHLLLDTTNMSECYQYLGCLYKLESLSLSLIGATSELRNRLTLPFSLNKLFVYRCALEPKDLWMIGSLPQLLVLELEHVFLNDKFSFIEGQFLQLKFLKLKDLDLPDLLNADSSHFPFLEKLFFDSLLDLREIPSSIGEIPTLELIHVACCSHSAAISAIRIKEDELQNQGDDALQVQLKIYCGN